MQSNILQTTKTYKSVKITVIIISRSLDQFWGFLHELNGATNRLEADLPVRAEENYSKIASLHWAKSLYTLKNCSIFAPHKRKI